MSSLTYIFVNLSHKQKAWVLIFFTDSGIVISPSKPANEKASDLIFINVWGKSARFKLSQQEKAWKPIVSRPSLNSTNSRVLQ